MPSCGEEGVQGDVRTLFQPLQGKRRVAHMRVLAMERRDHLFFLRCVDLRCAMLLTMINPSAWLSLSLFTFQRYQSNTLSLREVKYLAQRHTARKWWCQGFPSGQFMFRVSTHLTTLLREVGWRFLSLSHWTHFSPCLSDASATPGCSRRCLPSC